MISSGALYWRVPTVPGVRRRSAGGPLVPPSPLVGAAAWPRVGVSGRGRGRVRARRRRKVSDGELWGLGTREQAAASSALRDGCWPLYAVCPAGRQLAQRCRCLHEQARAAPHPRYAPCQSLRPSSSVRGPQRCCCRQAAGDWRGAGLKWGWGGVVAGFERASKAVPMEVGQQGRTAGP